MFYYAYITVDIWSLYVTTKIRSSPLLVSIERDGQPEVLRPWSARTRGFAGLDLVFS